MWNDFMSAGGVRYVSLHVYVCIQALVPEYGHPHYSCAWVSKIRGGMYF